MGESMAINDNLREIENILSTFESFKKRMAVDTEKYMRDRLQTESDKIYKSCEAAVEKRLESAISEMQKNQKIQQLAIDSLSNRVISLENKISIMSNVSAEKQIEVKAESGLINYNHSESNNSNDVKYNITAYEVKKEQIEMEQDNYFTWNINGQEEFILNA